MKKTITEITEGESALTVNSNLSPYDATCPVLNMGMVWLPRFSGSEISYVCSLTGDDRCRICKSSGNYQMFETNEKKGN